MRASRRVERTAKRSNTFWLNFSAGGKAAFKPSLIITKAENTANSQSVTYSGNTFCPLWGICILSVRHCKLQERSVDLCRYYTNVQKSILFNLVVEAYTCKIKKKKHLETKLNVAKLTRF